MGQMGNLNLALGAEPQELGRGWRAEGKIEQRRSGDFRVDQGLALRHGAGETIPSLVNIGIDRRLGLRLGLSPDLLAG
jgi:hypothetical protein